MQSERVRLISVLGLGFGIAVTVGNTIGTGILRTPGEIAQRVPSMAIYFALWIGGALYALLGANVLAELASRFPLSGGQYVYSREVLGRYAGFLVGWTDWIATCGSGTAAAVVIGESLFRLAGIDARLTAIVVVIGVVVVQWRGTSQAGRAQEVATAVKGLVLTALVIICFLHPSASGFTMTAPGAAVTFAAIIVALQSIIYTYDGWSGVIYFSEEVTDRRDIARSMFGSLAGVTLLYLLINAGFLYVLPLSSLRSTDLAVGLVAETLFGPWGDRVVRVLIIATLLSATTAFQMMATRVLFGLSRDRLFSARFAVVNAGGTPVAAHLATAAVMIVFIAVPAFSALLAIISFFFVAGYLFSFFALMVVRSRERSSESPLAYRAIAHPISTIVAIVLSTTFLGGAIYADPRNSLGAAAIVALSFPLYLLTRRKAADGDTMQR